MSCCLMFTPNNGFLLLYPRYYVITLINLAFEACSGIYVLYSSLILI